MMGRGQRRWYVHRVSWELHNGPIPDGLWVLHHCDNPPCVRPDHLFLGDHAANMRDAVAKGRTRPASRIAHLPRGESHHKSKLTESTVRDIRTRHSSGTPIRRLAREYGVTQSAIQSVVRRQSWRHVA